MQGIGDDLLSGSGFAVNEYGGAGGRDFLGQAHNVEHVAAGGDEAVQGGLHRLLQGTVFPFQPPDAKRAIENDPQNGEVQGFLVEIPGTQTGGAHPAPGVAVAGGDDDLGFWGLGEHVLQTAHTFLDAGRIRRQAEVLKDHGGRVRLERTERLFAGFGEHRRILFQRPAQLAYQFGIVFDDQQAVCRCVHEPPSSSRATSGSQMRKRVPAPRRLSTSTSPRCSRAKARVW